LIGATGQLSYAASGLEREAGVGVVAARLTGGHARMQTHREGVEPTPTVATDRTESTAYDASAGRRATSIKITRAIYVTIGVIEALLVIRFILKALAANAEAGFAQLIFAVTEPLVAPLMGLFDTPRRPAARYSSCTRSLPW
jgi:hypothetical protein